MKKYRLIDNDELIATPEDIKTLIRTTDSLEPASEDNCGESYFLRTSCMLGNDFYLRGYVYKCMSHWETDPVTGVKRLVYKWEVATYSESGALDKVTNVSTQEVESIGEIEDSTELRWRDPEDKKFLDSENNASWAFTAIVRKLIPAGTPASEEGNYIPKSLDDGELVGMSGIRNQYELLSFKDYYPKGNKYKYNLFAVTKYGVATGLDADDDVELTWKFIQTLIDRGLGGTIFSIGDCVTIEHDLFGSIDLQVAHMGPTLIRTKNGNLSSRFAVTFASRECLPKCTYDAKEYPYISDPEGRQIPNPADLIGGADAEYYASARGRADWISSNLRQFLNARTTFYKSADRQWNIGKYYFELVDGHYVAVPIPIWPSRVDPSELGYYEARYSFTAQHDWDKDAGPNEQVCQMGHRVLPGFFDFLPADFKEVLATKVVPTIGSNYTNGDLTTGPQLQQGKKTVLVNGTAQSFNTVFLNGELAESKLKTVMPLSSFPPEYQYCRRTSSNGVYSFVLVNRSAVVKNQNYFYYDPGKAPKYPVVLTDDVIFIPSFKELFGVNCSSIFTGYEGEFWPLYNPSVFIPDLGETRSHLKYDVTGQLSGYYTRSLGVIKTVGDTGVVKGDSTVCTVKSKGFTEPPPLGTPVDDIAPCSMSKAAASKKDANGIYLAPGVVWCCVVAKTED